MYIGPTKEQMSIMKLREIERDTSTWLTGKTLIGLKVRKNSNRPFKSGEKVNTVKDVVRNPNTNLWAASFIEDNSVVDIKQIKLASDE